MVTHAYAIKTGSRELERLFEQRKEIEARIKLAAEAQETRVALLAHCKKAQTTRGDLMWVYHQLPPTRITTGARLKRVARATKKTYTYPPKAELAPFGKRIYELRKAKNLSATQVSKVVGMHTSMIASWERGIWRPKADALAKLEKLYGVSLKNLLPNEKEK